MKKFFEKIFKDKRILVIYILVIILIIAGVTYALNISSLNIAGTTAVIGIDEEAYGENSIDTSGIKLRPILDNKVETSLENVIKIDFLVGGNINNTTDEVIYDIALVDLEMDDELSSQYVKWKLVKNGSTIFYDDFSDVSSGERVVLTTEQQDLVSYNEDKSLYDSYTFYLWLSDSCQKSIGSCTNYVDQSNLLNKHISGKIEVELYTGSKNGQGNGNMQTTPLLSDYIISLYNDGSTKINTTVGDGPQTVSLNETERIMMVDQGTINGVNYGVEYRYYGSSPNNYVSYNGELWRIISVSKVFSSESDVTGETRVRIIKDTSIGSYPWDNYDSESVDGNYSSDWADATLMCQLNTLYYNDTIEVCSGKTLTSLSTSLNDDAINLIDDAVWYLGTGGNSNLYADGYYNMERNNSGYGSYSARWIGKVGIMYPSDYGYASDLNQCTKTGFNYVDWNSWSPDPNCAGTNWLFSGVTLSLITPRNEYDNLWCIYTTGYVSDGSGDCFISDYLNVIPVVVLKSNVMITGGTGTSGDPYQLSLGE